MKCIPQSDLCMYVSKFNVCFCLWANPQGSVFLGTTCRMKPPPRRIGLGGLVMRELASQVRPSPPERAKRSKACPKLKACREKAPGHVPDSEKVYYLNKERAAKALAALSLSWAPHAGIAMGLPPHCSEAKEVAAIKAQEWASVEARTLWQAKSCLGELGKLCLGKRSRRRWRCSSKPYHPLDELQRNICRRTVSVQRPSLGCLTRRSTRSAH